MDKMIAAVKGLESFSADIRRVHRVPVNGFPIERKDMSLAFKRPALLDLQVSRFGHVVADGTPIRRVPASTVGVPSAFPRDDRLACRGTEVEERRGQCPELAPVGSRPESLAETAQNAGLSYGARLGAWIMGSGAC